MNAKYDAVAAALEADGLRMRGWVASPPAPASAMDEEIRQLKLAALTGSPVETFLLEQAQKSQARVQEREHERERSGKGKIVSRTCVGVGDGNRAYRDIQYVTDGLGNEQLFDHEREVAHDGRFLALGGALGSARPLRSRLSKAGAHMAELAELARMSDEYERSFAPGEVGPLSLTKRMDSPFANGGTNPQTMNRPWGSPTLTPHTVYKDALDMRVFNRSAKPVPESPRNPAGRVERFSELRGMTVPTGNAARFPELAETVSEQGGQTPDAGGGYDR